MKLKQTTMQAQMPQIDEKSKTKKNMLVAASLTKQESKEVVVMTQKNVNQLKKLKITRSDHPAFTIHNKFLNTVLKDTEVMAKR